MPKIPPAPDVTLSPKEMEGFLNYLERWMDPDHKSDGDFKARCRCVAWDDTKPCCLLRFPETARTGGE